MRQHPMLSGVTQRHNSNSNAASHTSDIGILAVELKRLADLIVDGVSKHGFGVGMLWLEHPALGAGQPGMGLVSLVHTTRISTLPTLTLPSPSLILLDSYCFQVSLLRRQKNCSGSTESLLPQAAYFSRTSANLSLSATPLFI